MPLTLLAYLVAGFLVFALLARLVGGRVARRGRGRADERGSRES